MSWQDESGWINQIETRLEQNSDIKKPRLSEVFSVRCLLKAVCERVGSAENNFDVQGASQNRSHSWLWRGFWRCELGFKIILRDSTSEQTALAAEVIEHDVFRIDAEVEQHVGA